MDKTVKKLLTGGQKSASSLKMDLDVKGRKSKNAICFKNTHTHLMHETL